MKALVALSLLLSLLAGCPLNSGGGDDDTGGGAGTGIRNYDGVTLQDACTASCNAQAATNCPGVLAPADCTENCLELQGALHCPDAWRDINACMAGASLFCDRVNGGAAVSADDCGPELDALDECI
jgi:hypothetical protein